MSKSIAFFLGDLGIGGVERVLLTYANELSTQGFDVSFIIAKSGDFLVKELYDSVTLIPLRKKRVYQSIFALRKVICHLQPNYVITGGDTPNIMVVLACLFTKSKAIISQHNYNDIEASRNEFFPGALHKLMRLTYPLAFKVLAVSQGIAQYLVEKVGIKDSKIKVLYNPIDIETLKKRALAPLNIEIPDKYILFVGRISPVKNLPFLLKAYDHSIIPGYSLVIVGDGLELDSLRKQRDTLKKKDSIVFTGLVHNPIPYIKNCSTLVLCSFSEAMPTVLLEAMAFEKPIVATPTPGAKEILGYREGTFISESFDDVDEFASLLEKSVSCVNSELSKCAKQYDKNIIIKQLKDMLA